MRRALIILAITTSINVLSEQTHCFAAVRSKDEANVRRPKINRASEPWLPGPAVFFPIQTIIEVSAFSIRSIVYFFHLLLIA